MIRGKVMALKTYIREERVKSVIQASITRCYEKRKLNTENKRNKDKNSKTESRWTQRKSTKTKPVLWKDKTDKNP